MSVTPMRPIRTAEHQAQDKAGRVYAIAFDLDTRIALQRCGEGWRGTCYEQISRVLTEYGFTRQQGSVFVGDHTTNPVKCVTAVQEIDRRYAWFASTVKDLRMYRIEENNDLLPALSNRLRLDKDYAA